MHLDTYLHSVIDAEYDICKDSLLPGSGIKNFGFVKIGFIPIPIYVYYDFHDEALRFYHKDDYLFAPSRKENKTNNKANNDSQYVYMGDFEKVQIPKTRSLSSGIAINFDGSHPTPMFYLKGKDSAPEFDIIYPDGKRYNFDELYQTSHEDTPYPETIFFYVNKMKNTTYVGLNNPEAGKYTLITKNKDESGDIEAGLFKPIQQLKATLNSSKARSTIDSININLQNTTSSSVTIYAANKKVFNTGYEISRTYKNLSDGVHSLQIDRNSESLHSGYYHVYAKIEDTNGIPYFVWLDNKLKITNEQSAPHHEEVSVTLKDGKAGVSWRANDEYNFKYHHLHLYKNGSEDKQHSHLYGPDEENFNLHGLEPDTEYEVEIESLNNAGYTTRSNRVSFKTTNDILYEGAPDLYVDVNQTQYYTKQNQYPTISVCNSGFNSIQSSILEIYYKKPISNGRLNDHEVQNILPKTCSNIAVNISDETIDNMSFDYSDVADTLFVKIKKTSPTEYADNNNFENITFKEPIFIEAKAVLIINKGWNLISLPLTSNTLSLKNLHEVKRIWQYDALNGWIKNPKQIYPGKGYMLEAEEAFSIEVNGRVDELSHINYSKGWHLLGASKDLESLHKDERIKLTWVLRDGIWIKDPEQINANEGYWIYINKGEE